MRTSLVVLRELYSWGAHVQVALFLPCEGFYQGLLLVTLVTAT